MEINTYELAKALGIPESTLRAAAIRVSQNPVSNAFAEAAKADATQNPFATAARADPTHTSTENGAQALKTTSDARLDLFSVIGALRTADDERLIRLFENAYAMDPLFATKILFYGRDIRGGLGERKTFRTLLKYAAQRHPEAIKPNIDLIGLYGRYDDLYELIGTPLEDDMWTAMKKQWNMDILAMKRGEAVSLLGKWVKTADASSKKTRKLGILTAQKLGLSVYDYKRQYRALRKHIGVVEQLMSQNRWDEIKYPEVPSRAMTLYRDAFKRHDEERFVGYLEKVTSGEEKIHAGALYPYDLVKKYIWSGRFVQNPDPVVEAQWQQMLKDYGESLESAIVISDTSGSMFCDGNMPIASSLALGLLFASVNQGPYHGLFMEFSTRSDFIQIKGATLLDQLRNMMADAYWGQSTNLEGAFEKILDVALVNGVSCDDMPKALVVISDMEIDGCLHDHWREDGDWSFHDRMAKRFASMGYSMPTVIYWNVNSRHDIYHADADRPGCVLVSGHSASTFKQVLKCINMTPIEAMEEIINSERYQPVTIGVAPHSGRFTWGE